MTRAVFGKEMKVLWASPLPYVLGALFHVTLGTLGWAQVGGRGQAVFQPIVPIAGFLLIVVTPILASRTFSDEIRSGTLDLLLAVPVRRGALVVGKYLAVLLTLLAVLAPIGLYALVLALWGDPDPGPIVTGLVGLVLLAVLMSAVAVFASSLTSSTAVATVIGLFSVLLLWFAHTGSDTLPGGDLFGGFSISERLRSFAGGLIDASDVAFFVGVACVALAAAAVAVESRRLR